MRRTPALFAVFFFLASIFSGISSAQEPLSFSWDVPKKVDEKTVFFGERTRLEGPGDLEPRSFPDEKSYAWRLMEQGNNFLVAGRFEEAVVAFAKCYEVPGPTRVLSGFKLVEAEEKLGRWDEAIAVLEDMKQRYLVSTKEFGEAARIRAELEDGKRKSLPVEKPGKVTGREWLMELQTQRMKFVLQGMEVLRMHGVPLKEPAQSYVFRLDEYFIAHPEAPAEDPAAALAVVVYEADEDSRLPIDRWKLHPDYLPEEEQNKLVDTKDKLNGAQWIRMTHNQKMDYVLGAMEVLKGQNVPMQKSVYAYVYAADQLFTDKPELLASDSVVTLASILYEAEPDARDVLEAIRLR